MFKSKKIIISSFIFLFFLFSFTFLATQEAEGFVMEMTLLSTGYNAIQNIAQGQGWDPIGDTIVNAIGGAVFNFIFGIFEFLSSLGPALLSFVLSDSFVNQSGSDSEVVKAGWGIVRNLANAALVIGLVIIAINIILGREEGKAKQTLVNFVIVALLINFTPLICGFFIDGANIIAKSFLQGGLDSGMNNQLKIFGASLVESTQNVFSLFIGIFALLIFTLISLAIYLLYALLFIARTIILWILIIASPIALATKVFPKSNAVRKFFPSILYWDDWYEMFLQWVIIVIPASLFIFLGNKAISAVQLPAHEGIEFIPFMVQSMFHFLLPMVFLLAGFMITISSGGSVAAPLGALGKKAWGATAGAAGGYMAGKAVAGAKATGSWVKEGAVGSAAAIIKRENPINKSARDSGRASVDKVKSSIGGAMTGAKDYLRIGESNTWAKRSAETEKQLAEGMDNYFDGSGEENVVKFNLAQQQLEKLRLSKSLSQKELSKRYENLFIAAANNGNIEDSAIENFLSQSKGRGVDVDYGKMLRGTSAVDIMKKYKPKALERGFVAEKLVDTKQGKYILTDDRATQAHSAALARGIENSNKTETKTEGARDIGGNSYAGNIAGINQEEQKLAGELDSLNKLGSNLTPEQEKRRDEVSDQLKSLKSMR